MTSIDARLDGKEPAPGARRQDVKKPAEGSLRVRGVHLCMCGGGGGASPHGGIGVSRHAINVLGGMLMECDRKSRTSSGARHASGTGCGASGRARMIIVARRKRPVAW